MIAPCEPGAGGREGPKSESSLLAEGDGDGGVVGRSRRSAGGGAGPIRWRFETESVDELRELDMECGDAEAAFSSRLRFER